MFQRPDPWDINVFIRGSEIPKWFRHQSVGASMEFLEEGSSDFMGIALCAVFVRRQHHLLHQSPSEIWGFGVHCHCNIARNESRGFLKESVGIDSYNLYHESKISNLHQLATYYLTYIDEIMQKTNQTEYHLLVWSLGGRIALEIAAILENNGITKIARTPQCQ